MTSKVRILGGSEVTPRLKVTETQTHRSEEHAAVAKTGTPREKF